MPTIFGDSNLLRTTKAQKAAIKKLIQSDNFYLKEKVWNYLIADILSYSPNRYDYIKVFCNNSISISSGIDIWFEAQPLSARKGSIRNSEGNNIIDLAFGNIRNRYKTASGIKYGLVENDPWTCFVEGKFFSDCSPGIAYDPFKNQIVHIIENLLCFQGDGNFPEDIFFTLLTPRLFKKNPKSRLYGYKMEEYKDTAKIIEDINKSIIEKRRDDDWNYPDDLESRVKLLNINWITYEQILEKEYNIKKLDLTNIEQNIKNIFKKQLKTLAKNI